MDSCYKRGSEPLPHSQELAASIETARSRALGKIEAEARIVEVQKAREWLARQGWNVDEIARTVKISRGEVELTIEFGVKG